ncbi:MAG: hypothetical protein A3G93_12755 [Nitrospinae bacterium RIFCSPLOWO2_12_FULL_45_22]|nr:MAG: hypothetical protein A3G93_12755 [Nitrospinae bacterium RIFCSPLOWO2_12_FULL_45_22]
MEFGFTKEQEQLREGVRSFLEQELAAESFAARSNQWVEGFSQEFSRKVAQRGWIGMTWPREYSGQGRSYIDRAILMEEMLRYQAPIGYHFLGDRQVGPSLMHFGSDELKKEFLPRIINASVSFCLGFSEPDAGSDLVAVRTNAREEGDYYVINGQKVWTSLAHKADYIWILARTDPEAPKHKALSELIIDLKSPGITIRPIINMAGAHSFNEVFFEEVKTPRTYLVGGKNRGFYQIMTQVDYERAGLERLMQNYPLFEKIIKFLREDKGEGARLRKDPIIRDSIGRLEVEYQTGRLFCYYVAWVLDQGRIPNYEAALCKAYCTQFEQRLNDIATRILGLYGQLLPGSKWAPINGEAPESYLFGPSYTLQGGTVEILKNIVATRGLGLPTS